jgi:8-oxo-dGTP pyrophosphatase MutT (NUDIX family)
VIPAWLEPVREGAAAIGADDLSRFVPPEDADARPGAVLMLFGEGPGGPDLLLTERAHHMRSHPGQVSFPGGSIDPTDPSPVAAALREAEEETGLDPAGVEVFAELPPLWLPPSNFSVTPVLGWWREPTAVHAVSADEVHAVYRTPIAELRDPAHRITVTGPGGWRSPGFLIGPDKDVICWGFTAGVIARLFEYLGWIEDLPDAPEQELPPYMLIGRRPDQELKTNTEFDERRRR